MRCATALPSWDSPSNRAPNRCALIRLLLTPPLLTQVVSSDFKRKCEERTVLDYRSSVEVLREFCFQGRDVGFEEWILPSKSDGGSTTAVIVELHYGDVVHVALHYRGLEFAEEVVNAMADTLLCARDARDARTDGQTAGQTAQRHPPWQDTQAAHAAPVPFCTH